jgi:hypothetical protein
VKRSVSTYLLASAMGTGLAATALVGSHALASVAPTDPRTAAIARWLGTSVHDQGWRHVSDQSGSRYQTHMLGLGLVEVDAVTNEVDEVIFDGRLDSTTAAVRPAQAETVAAAFGHQHFAGFAGLVLRDNQSVDHGSFKERRLQWQARAGQAWLPTRVTIGINATTGAVAYFWSERVPVHVSTVPAVSGDAAAQSAAAAAPGLTMSSPASLEVEVNGVTQKLVWVSEWTHAYTSGVHVSDYRVLWTDAQTGTTQVVARG